MLKKILLSVTAISTSALTFNYYKRNNDCKAMFDKIHLTNTFKQEYMTDKWFGLSNSTLDKLIIKNNYNNYIKQYYVNGDTYSIPHDTWIIYYDDDNPCCNYEMKFHIPIKYTHYYTFSDKHNDHQLCFYDIFHQVLFFKPEFKNNLNNHKKT